MSGEKPPTLDAETLQVLDQVLTEQKFFEKVREILLDLEAANRQLAGSKYYNAKKLISRTIETVREMGKRGKA